MIRAGLIALSLVTPVHDWYPWDCCSGRDCFAVEPDDLVEVEGGWEYLPRKMFFSKDKVKPSQDANFHVCIGNYEFNKDKPLCVFIVQGS
jgi:hypothetical protein